MKECMKKSVLSVILIVFVLLCSGLFFLIADNAQIEFVEGTYDDIVVSYNEEIPENNVKATISSNILHKNKMEIPVEVEKLSIQNVKDLGKYTVNFRAKYFYITKLGSYSVDIIDKCSPILTVNEETLEYSCVDEIDGDITDRVLLEKYLDKIIFSVSDNSENKTEYIVYRDNKAPVITYSDNLLNYQCIDNVDGDITDRVKYYESGGYFYYTATDNSGNTAEISRKIENGNKVIYLTFDDGPSVHTARLLDILNKYNVKATFFVVGVSRYLDILPRMEKEGHMIAAHTDSHNYSTVYSSVDNYFVDLQDIQDKIYNQLNHKTKLVRFPGGSSNTVSKKYCKGVVSEISEELKNKGYTYFDWNVSSGDAGETTKTDVVIENIKRGIQNHNVSVVLQHDSKGFSVDAVEEVIKWGLERGYVFLSLTEQSSTMRHKIAN